MAAGGGMTQVQKRILLVALAIIGVVTIAATVALRTPSPVGHWDGAEGFDRYLAAYEEACQQQHGGS